MPAVPPEMLTSTTTPRPATKPIQEGYGTTTVASNITTLLPYTCKQGWSEFMNIDTPTESHSYETEGPGDYEMMFELRKYYSFCAKPTGIKCQTVTDKLPYSMSLDLDVMCNLETGLQCLNSKQGGFNCADYEVSVNCDCGSKFVFFIKSPYSHCKRIPLNSIS